MLSHAGQTLGRDAHVQQSARPVQIPINRRCLALRSRVLAVYLTSAFMVIRADESEQGNVLIFGAGMTTTHITGAGSGFTSWIITSPDADIAEDKDVTSTGVIVPRLR